jgi:hypothetical protein
MPCFGSDLACFDVTAYVYNTRVCRPLLLSISVVNCPGKRSSTHGRDISVRHLFSVRHLSFRPLIVYLWTWQVEAEETADVGEDQQVLEGKEAEAAPETAPEAQEGEAVAVVVEAVDPGAPEANGVEGVAEAGAPADIEGGEEGVAVIPPESGEEAAVEEGAEASAEAGNEGGEGGEGGGAERGVEGGVEVPPSEAAPLPVVEEEDLTDLEPLEGLDPIPEPYGRDASGKIIPLHGVESLFLTGEPRQFFWVAESASK